MFKRPSVHYGRTPAPVTPYQKAAQVWDERIGSARVQAKNWRLIAFGSLILSAGLASGLVWQSTQGSITPWVIEVDRLGQAEAVSPANPFYQPTDPQIAFHLARFIENVRGLSADAIVLRQDWLRAYDFATDRGAAALNDHARVKQQEIFRPVLRRKAHIGDDQRKILLVAAHGQHHADVTETQEQAETDEPADIFLGVIKQSGMIHDQRDHRS